MTGFFDITESYPNGFKGYEYNHETKEITEGYYTKYKFGYEPVNLDDNGVKLITTDFIEPHHIFVQSNQENIFYSIYYRYNEDFKSIRYYKDGVLVFVNKMWDIRQSSFVYSEEITKKEYLKLIHQNALITEADYD